MRVIFLFLFIGAIPARSRRNQDSEGGDICNLSGRPRGSCRERHRLYYYTRGKCRAFTFRGCMNEGGRNKFETLEACQRTCMAPLASVCKVREPRNCGGRRQRTRYYFNTARGQCMQFQTNCSASRDANNFRRLRDCTKTCAG
ncbi:protease inhibitor 1-like [Ornithodoros turicata]|uniref:protease inhibitor 1-like n=1 Tax=Ornithodoros turicata TaxID=34597 RepID=UPI003138D56B